MLSDNPSRNRGFGSSDEERLRNKTALVEAAALGLLTIEKGPNGRAIVRFDPERVRLYGIDLSFFGDRPSVH